MSVAIKRAVSDGASSRPSHRAASSSSRDIDSVGRTTDKSCIRCRERKVRCGRSFPACVSCTRRGESCEYGDEVDGEDVQLRAPSGRIRIKRCSFKSKRTSSLPNLPVIDFFTPAPLLDSQNVLPSFSMLPAFSLFSLDDPYGAIYEAVTQDAGPEQHIAMYNFLTSVSPPAVEGESRTVARDLVAHLLDVSAYSCSLRLSAFASMAERIPTYKQHDTLSAADEIAVSVLCTIGARANPFPGFLGSSVSFTPISSAGQHRDRICQALVDHTVDLFFHSPLLQESRLENLEGLIAIVQLLTEEFQTDRARNFLQLALRMYDDVLRDSSAEESAIVKTACGPTLFQNDSVLSAICGCQSLIPRTELCRLFDSGSLPDFSHSDLSTELDYLLSGASISYEAIKAATASATTWVAGAFRIFSVISLELPPSSVVTEISTLWSHIDRAHAAIQRLRQTLSEIDGLPGRTGGALSAVEDHVLLAVTMDIRLISLVHLIHRFLEGQDGARSEAKEALMVDSWLRVRKCLKLLSFYSHTYATSHNKYLVCRLVLSLELLPSWTEIAVQRAGEDPGSISDEYELSEEELDWFTTALQLACFYTSVAPQRRDKLLRGRQHFFDPRYSATPSPSTSPALSPLSSPSEADLSTPPSEFLLPPSTSPFPYASGDPFGVVAQNAVSEGFKMAAADAFRGQSWIGAPMPETWDSQMTSGSWDGVGAGDQQWYL